MHTLWLFMSATNRALSSLARARAMGWSNEAPVPVPSMSPNWPLPATVDTMPVESERARMAWEYLSALDACTWTNVRGREWRGSALST